MPHFGQSPGLSDSTPGHIGQKYVAAAEGFTIAPPCSWQQQVEPAEVEWFLIIYLKRDGLQRQMTLHRNYKSACVVPR
jgi:hypothetical protein